MDQNPNKQKKSGICCRIGYYSQALPPVKAFLSGFLAVIKKGRFGGLFGRFERFVTQIALIKLQWFAFDDFRLL